MVTLPVILTVILKVTLPGASLPSSHPSILPPRSLNSNLRSGLPLLRLLETSVLCLGFLSRSLHGLGNLVHGHENRKGFLSYPLSACLGWFPSIPR